MEETETQNQNQTPQSKKKVTLCLEETKSGLSLKDSLARQVWLGEATLIVNPLRFENVEGRAFYLLSDSLCYGVLKVNKVNQITLEDFIKLEQQHKMNVQDCSGKQVLFSYEFELQQKFEQPKKISPIDSARFIVENISIIPDEPKGIEPFTTVKLMEPSVKFSKIDDAIKFMFGGTTYG